MKRISPWVVFASLVAIAVVAVLVCDFTSIAHAHDLRTVMAEGGAGVAATEELVRQFKAHHEDIKTALTKAGAKDSELEARLDEMAQKMVRFANGDGGGGDFQTKSWGQSVVDSEEYKSLAGSPNQRGRAVVRLKALITTGSTSGGAFYQNDRQEYDEAVHSLPRRRMRFRELLASGRTTKTSVEFPRQTTRTNAAATQTEGALKGESALAWETLTAPVRTIAHWIPASKQVLDDAPMLASIINNELRYMLEDVEENQLLNGAGTGTDLNGVYTQATAFAAPFIVATPTVIDVLLLAIAQIQTAGFEPDGITLNPVDWAKLQSIKDTTGAYLGSGPFSAADVSRLWRLPVVTTTAMAAGKFLVSTSIGAQVFDRQDAIVEVSSEDSDNFRRNLVTIRAEERLALAVYRPTAFVKGDIAAGITDALS